MQIEVQRAMMMEMYLQSRLMRYKLINLYVENFKNYPAHTDCICCKSSETQFTKVPTLEENTVKDESKMEDQEKKTKPRKKFCNKWKVWASLCSFWKF